MHRIFLNLRTKNIAVLLCFQSQLKTDPLMLPFKVVSQRSVFGTKAWGATKWKKQGSSSTLPLARLLWWATKDLSQSRGFKVLIFKHRKVFPCGTAMPGLLTINISNNLPCRRGSNNFPMFTKESSTRKVPFTHTPCSTGTLVKAGASPPLSGLPASNLLPVPLTTTNTLQRDRRMAPTSWKHPTLFLSDDSDFLLSSASFSSYNFMPLDTPRVLAV